MLANRALVFTTFTVLICSSSVLPAQDSQDLGPVVIEETGGPNAPTPEPELTEEEKKAQQRITIPIPVGQDARGLKIPSFNSVGVLQMEFSAAEALRVDEEIVKLDDVAIELFDDEGASNFRIEMVAAEFDLETQILSTNQPFTVRRTDFKLEGENVKFDTSTRKGHVEGKVRMYIYDKNAL